MCLGSARLHPPISSGLIPSTVPHTWRACPRPADLIFCRDESQPFKTLIGILDDVCLGLRTSTPWIPAKHEDTLRAINDILKKPGLKLQVRVEASAPFG